MKLLFQIFLSIWLISQSSASASSLLRKINSEDNEITFLKAEITEKYWNSLASGYSNNWINTPPLLSGVGNGLIDEVKEIPQLVFLAADLATNQQTIEAIWNSLSSLTLDKVFNAGAGVVTQWSDKYAQGGDVSWHQGGRDVVMVSSLLGIGILNKVDDAVKQNIDDVSTKVKNKSDEVVGAGRQISLLAEEALGGHSIARHGPQLTLLEMEQRVLGIHPTIPQSRSALRFETQAIHEDAVNKAFTQYRDEIDAFFANPNNTYKEWTFDYGSKVGSGYTNTGTLSNPVSQAVTSNQVTISIKRVTNNPRGYRLESAFPDVR